MQIPILQERITVDESNAKQLLDRFKLSEKNYILYAGLIKETKGINLLLEAYCNYLQKDGLQLVLVGLNKCTHVETIRRLRYPGIYHLGNQKRDTVLALMSKASVCVNLSSSEGLPRASLEAISIGCPVVLPRGVSEFSQYCPEFVVEKEQPETVATQIRRTVSKKIQADFPVEDHYPEKIIPRYLELFNSNNPSFC